MKINLWRIRAAALIKSMLFSVVFTVLFVVFSFAGKLIPTGYDRLSHGITGTIAALLTTVVFLRFEKKRFYEIGLSIERNTVLRFFGGMVIGVILMGMLAAGVLFFSKAVISINSTSDVLHFFLVTIPLLPLAFMEELGFRAYPLEILRDKTGIRTAVVLTSILFALYHLANGWTFAASFYGPAVWGLIFGLSAVHSRGIAMPTGMHYAVNLTTAAFGEPGNSDSIWTIEHSMSSVADQNGTDWQTILPSALLFVFAIACMELYARRSNR